MRCTRRNKHRIWVCVYTGERDIRDKNGKKTGEKVPVYTTPHEVWLNVSPATGQSGTEQFGTLENYDKVLVTNDLSCPIDERSALFIDKDPSYTSVFTGYISTSTSTSVAEYVNVPVADYTVRRVAKSLNSMSVAVRKVTVT